MPTQHLKEAAEHHDNASKSYKQAADAQAANKKSEAAEHLVNAKGHSAKGQEASQNAAKKYAETSKKDAK